MCTTKTKVAPSRRNMSRVARLTDTDDIRRLRRHPWPGLIHSGKRPPSRMPPITCVWNCASVFYASKKPRFCNIYFFKTHCNDFRRKFHNKSSLGIILCCKAFFIYKYAMIKYHNLIKNKHRSLRSILSM